MAVASGEMGGKSAVHSVAGSFDPVVMAQLRESEALAGFLVRRIRGIDGVTRTATLIAILAHSHYGLVSVFDRS